MNFKENDLLEDREGKRYFLSSADDFAVEVELLRKNHDFLAFLDECKKDGGSIPLEEVEQKYR